MRLSNLIFIILLGYSFTIHSQNSNYKSIHQMESEYYKTVEEVVYSGSEPYKRNLAATSFGIKKNNPLMKRIFGYNPYWSGTNYLNYQWDLISDLCHFSYEIDPATGEPLTTHNWDTSPAIDSALSNGVKVHLCVTLFSGHYGFFSNDVAQQTLIDNVIAMIQERGAHGVNVDIESVPSSLSSYYTGFIKNLSDQMKDSLEEAEISIATPAVDWTGLVNIEELNDYVHFFLIMGYDYYWNGSNQAGPVSPLYPMVEDYIYNFSWSISYYQSKGVPPDKIIMGIPYYARQWPTAEQYAPSSTMGNGEAFTYANIQNNTSGNYSIENKHWEENSFSPYFSFYTDQWNQCFVEDIFSLGKKYDIINRRGIAGIGIWALGYDDGYTGLWDLIEDKFTATSASVGSDSIFDSGGPVFNYYSNEIYSYTLSANSNEIIQLNFLDLELEDGYDTLWLFDGPDDQSSLITSLTGDVNPPVVFSTSNKLTLKFKSDGALNKSGWKAVYDNLVISDVPVGDLIWATQRINVYPNPFSNHLYIDFELEKRSKIQIKLSNVSSATNIKVLDKYFEKGRNQIRISSDEIGLSQNGFYLISFMIDNKILSKGLIKLKK